MKRICGQIYKSDGYVTSVKRSEKWVKTKVSELLKKHNVWYFMPAMGAYGRAGIPDYICCINGMMLAIETKDDKNTLTSLQKLEGEKITKADGVFVVVRPDRLEVLDSLVLAMKEGHSDFGSIEIMSSFQN